ncbi:hypothetical protein MP228_011256 [Amoeboaphelidium protococcarum]|nr:hypothetical protein MP228_011256 [Amoeboaphelidium protococcarum]
MPKASKKKKQQKNADFQKTKLKLGKRLTTDASHTRTDVKSKQIYVPVQQQMVLDQAKKRRRPEDQNDICDLQSSKGLTVKDITIKFKHPSAQVRKDAIQNLKDLVQEQHESILSAESDIVSLLIVPVLRFMLDTDQDLRQVLMKYLEMICALNLVTVEQLQPFRDVIIVHLKSALSHNDDGVRVDSLKILHLYLYNYQQMFLSEVDGMIQSVLQLLSQRTDATFYDQKSCISMVPSSKLNWSRSKLTVLNVIKSLLELKYKSTVNVGYTECELQFSDSTTVDEIIRPVQLLCKYSPGVMQRLDILVNNKQPCYMEPQLFKILLELWNDCVHRIDDPRTGKKKKNDIEVVDAMVILLQLMLKMIACSSQLDQNDCARLIKKHIPCRYPMALTSSSIPGLSNKLKIINEEMRKLLTVTEQI